MKEKVLTEHFGLENLYKIDVYKKQGGYQAT
ncbi:hypothetical protein LCGC14_1749130, partial [marine sediment metagenome]